MLLPPGRGRNASGQASPDGAVRGDMGKRRMRDLSGQRDQDRLYKKIETDGDRGRMAGQAEEGHHAVGASGKADNERFARFDGNAVHEDAWPSGLVDDLCRMVRSAHGAAAGQKHHAALLHRGVHDGSQPFIDVGNNARTGSGCRRRGRRGLRDCRNCCPGSGPVRDGCLPGRSRCPWR